MVSALQRVDVVEVGTMKVAVDQQHDREADADFRGGDREHEQREHLAGDRVVERPERDEVDVDRGEHQLDAHQHEHGVLARQNAIDPGAEEERSEQQELVEQHQSRLARTTAPISAPSKSTPTTSNGIRYVRKIAFVTSWVWIGPLRLISTPWNVCTSRPPRMPARNNDAAAAGHRRSLPSDSSGCIGARVSMIPNRNSTITAPM